jgi:L,D-transpeptidase catalytic domain
MEDAMQLLSTARTTSKGARHAQRARRTFDLFARLTLGIVAASMILSACSDGSQAQAAVNAQARLDKELRTARTQLDVPDALLAPIVTREQQVAASTAGGSDTSYQNAAAAYTQLYNKVVAIEHMSPDQAKAQTAADLQQLDTAIQAVQKQGFVETLQFQQREQQAQQQLAAAVTTKDFFQVDSFVQSQISAAQNIGPVYQQMQALNRLVSQQGQALGLQDPSPQPLQCAVEDTYSFWWDDPVVNATPQQTSATYEFQQWPAQDLSLFRAAASGQDYVTLSALLHAQTQQLSAEMTTLAPTEAAHLLSVFQYNIETYQQGGGKDQTFAQQAAQDAQQLSAAHTLKDYAAMVQTLQQQMQAMAVQLLKVQTQQDMQNLQKLVAKGQSIMVIDPANGIGYPLSYEYADQGGGIGDAEARLAQAQALSDYQAVDAEIKMFTMNLQAMLQDNSDTTHSDQPHQTDFNLMRYYGISSERVVVVSLSEQWARMYDNGKLVHSDPVTTGAPDLPSPPGIHCIFGKAAPFTLTSPYPKGDPRYYNPTKIQYAMWYAQYGFIMHDAWWRPQMGKYTNLPHYDPIAFNNGSHGCINMHTEDAAWLYSWSVVGTPVIVY